jgi:hypothetical protein
MSRMIRVAESHQGVKNTTSEARAPSRKKIKHFSIVLFYYNYTLVVLLCGSGVYCHK